jgi:Aldo/keto reductase family
MTLPGTTVPLAPPRRTPGTQDGLRCHAAPGLVSKVGASRGPSGEWLATQRPEELRRGVEANLRSLAVDQVHVVNPRRHPGGDVPRAEQLDAMSEIRDEGLMGGFGLSNLTLDEYMSAVETARVSDVACVQNAYSVSTRLLLRLRSPGCWLGRRRCYSSREPRRSPTWRRTSRLRASSWTTLHSRCSRAWPAIEELWDWRAVGLKSCRTRVHVGRTRPASER